MSLREANLRLYRAALASRSGANVRQMGRNTLKPRKSSRSVSEPESMLYDRIRLAGLPEPEREYRFAPDRRFRADFAWPADMLLVDVEGGIWARGNSGHSSGSGIERDIEKSNLAQLLGFTFLRFTRSMIESGQAVQQIKQALAWKD